MPDLAELKRLVDSTVEATVRRTVERRDGFSSVAVRGRHEPTVAGCVRQATADIRFEPQASRTFSEEYMP